MHRLHGWHQPVSSTDVGTELIREQQVAHARNLAQIKPTLATNQARPVYHHLTHRTKKALTEFNRAATIEHENLLLVSRFRNILSRKQVDNVPPVSAVPRSLNRNQRAAEMTTIVLENARFFKRIAGVRGQVGTRTDQVGAILARAKGRSVERSKEEVEAIIRRHCVHEFQNPLDYKKEYYVDPSNPYCNYSGGKEKVYVRPSSRYGRPLPLAPSPPPSSEEKSRCDSPTRASAAALQPVGPLHARTMSSSPKTVMRPQSALQPPTKLIAQDPVLLSARRHEGSLNLTRFIPVKQESNPEVVKRKVERWVEEDEKEETERRKRVDGQHAPPSASRAARIVLQRKRPQTARAAHSSPTRESAAATSASTTTTAAVATSASPSPSPSPPPHPHPLPPASIAPLFPTSRSAAPPPVLLFSSAAVTIGPKPNHVTMYESTDHQRAEAEAIAAGTLSLLPPLSVQLTMHELSQPWRIRIDAFDASSGVSWSVSIEFNALKPFFQTHPELFAPQDRLKAGLVAILKDSLCFVPSPTAASSAAHSDLVGHEAVERELCVDLVQPAPPLARVLPPRPGSAKRRAEQLKRERELAREKAKRERFQPKTETIVSPRGCGRDDERSPSRTGRETPVSAAATPRALLSPPTPSPRALSQRSSPRQSPLTIIGVPPGHMYGPQHEQQQQHQPLQSHPFDPHRYQHHTSIGGAAAGGGSTFRPIQLSDNEEYEHDDSPQQQPQRRLHQEEEEDEEDLETPTAAEAEEVEATEAFDLEEAFPVHSYQSTPPPSLPPTDSAPPSSHHSRASSIGSTLSASSVSGGGGRKIIIPIHTRNRTSLQFAPARPTPPPPTQQAQPQPPTLPPSQSTSRQSSMPSVHEEADGAPIQEAEAMDGGGGAQSGSSSPRPFDDAGSRRSSQLATGDAPSRPDGVGSVDGASDDGLLLEQDIMAIPHDLSRATSTASHVTVASTSAQMAPAPPTAITRETSVNLALLPTLPPSMQSTAASTPMQSPTPAPAPPSLASTHDEDAAPIVPTDAAPDDTIDGLGDFDIPDLSPSKQLSMSAAATTLEAASAKPAVSVVVPTTLEADLELELPDEI